MGESGALACWLKQAEAGQRHDWETVMGCFAADCEWTLVSTGLSLTGAEAIRNFMQGGLAAGERAPPEVKCAFGTDREGVFEYVSRGVTTASAATFTKSLSGSDGHLSGIEVSAGAPYEVHVCFVFRLNDAGRIAEVREYIATPPATA
jgi:SnoaL-like domain